MSFLQPIGTGVETSRRVVNRISVTQGHALASDDEAVEFRTVLGSCVSTCLFDPTARVGGMNHFLLAEPPKSSSNRDFDKDYGLFLMELLINEMFKLGASKSRMRGRLFGGANINTDLGSIGSTNAAFAREFLSREGIQCVSEDLEGPHARHVQFRPAHGQVRCRTVANNSAPKQKPRGLPKSDLGNVELF